MEVDLRRREPAKLTAGFLETRIYMLHSVSQTSCQRVTDILEL